MKRKIFVVGHTNNYANWMQGKLTHSIEKADLVVFTGGADVDPYLYRAKLHPTTWCNLIRDDYEIRAFDEARKLNKKLIGICRGAQLLCVLAGGSLVQHSDHPNRHEVITHEGAIVVTSLHHQRMYPWGYKKPNFKLLGWCNKLSPFNWGEDDQDLTGKPEVEFALFPDIDALCIQSHPEMAWPAIFPWEKKYIRFCRNLLDEHMEEKVEMVA